jgi:plasmid replication initiation protein
MENTIIKKPSAMIQINAKGLSTMQRKIINSLIYLAQKDSFGNIFYKTTLAVIKQLCNIKTTDNQEIKNKLEELSNITIKFNYLNKDYDHIWSAISILAEVHINFGNGEVKFAFPPTINEHIVKPKIYSPLNLVLVAGLTSNYSIALYELFRDYIDSYSFPKLSIEQLRDLLGIEENLYPRFQDFKKRALNVAIHEINTKTDISCSYELIKESGNRYSHIKFTIQKKKSEFLKKFDMALSCLEQVNPSESFEMIQEKIAKDFKISI